MKRHQLFLTVILLISLAGCGLQSSDVPTPIATVAGQGGVPTGTVVPLTVMPSTVTPSTVTPSTVTPATVTPDSTVTLDVTGTPVAAGTLAPTSVATAAPDATATPDDPDAQALGEEAIVIQQPGNRSRVTSPVVVAGVADPTFEQNLVVRIVLDDGTELAVGATTIAADMGERGLYAVAMPFEVDEERQGFIQVYDTSARDGGVLHLNSVGVTLAPSGDDEIVMADPAPERIAIYQPAMGESIAGGVVRVEGFALAGFEQTLVVQVLDVNGAVISQEPVMVMAPDLGQPGPFSVDIAYSVSSRGPGRVVVRDPSPAHGGDAHVASVEITLRP